MGPVRKLVLQNAVIDRLMKQSGDDGKPKYAKRSDARRAYRKVEACDVDTLDDAAVHAGVAVSFAGGFYDETAIRECISAAGYALPAEAIGDGEFLKWLFSDEGRAAVMAWVETIVKIIAILGPLLL